MIKEFSKLLEKYKGKILLAALLTVICDIFLWSAIFETTNEDMAAVYFFNVGQGDSELVRMGKTLMLIDGGPANGRVVENLEKVIAERKKYIDIVFLSHPQIDHFGGFMSVFERYDIGAILYSGSRGEGIAAQEFWNTAGENDIREIVVRKGDSICFHSDCFLVLSPSQEDMKELSENDLSLILLLKAGESKFLFAGDSGSLVENEIAARAGLIDVLKVSHHGSKFSSGKEFLGIIRPRIAVIEVGKNSYGHPSGEVLRRLNEVGASVLRTDELGIVSFVIKRDSLSVFAENVR